MYIVNQKERKMAIDSSKYVRVDVVYQRLTKIIKNKEIPFLDVVDWCSECELEEIGIVRDYYLFEDVELTIADLQAELPSNCARIIAVKRNHEPVTFYDNGNYLNFKQNYTNVYIDYYGIPVDSDSGYPLIIRGHEDACMKYCLKMLFYGDFIAGDIDYNRWMVINSDYENALSLVPSKSDRTTKNDRIKLLDTMRLIKYNYRNLKSRDA